MEEDLRKIRVVVESLVPGSVVYNCEARHVRREWKRQGQQIPIPADELQEAIYDQGTYNLFVQGYLGIVNPDHRKLVGLEYEGGDMVIPFSVADARKLLVDETDLTVFENKVRSLRPGSIETLISTAYTLKNVDYNKQKIIKDVLGVDIITLVKNNDQ